MPKDPQLVADALVSGLVPPAVAPIASSGGAPAMMADPAHQSVADALVSGLVPPVRSGGALPAHAPPELVAMADAAARRHGVDPGLLRAQIDAESSWNPRTVGPMTRYGQAKGIAQFMDNTGPDWGVHDPFDPAQSLEGMARFMRHNLDANGGDVSKALAAYNAGQGNVHRWRSIKETRDYVAKILRNSGNGSGRYEPSSVPAGMPDPARSAVTDLGANGVSSTAPASSGLDALHAQLANAERMVNAFRDQASTGFTPPWFKPQPGKDQGYYLRVMQETAAALQRARGADAPSNSTSLMLNPPGYRASRAPKGRVRDVPKGSLPQPEDPDVAAAAALARDPIGFALRAGLPGDGTGVLAPDSPILHERAVAANVAGLPFDLGSYYATVTGGGRQVSINKASELAGARQLKFGRDKAAAHVAVALGMIASVGPDYGEPFAPPLSDHDRKVIQNLQNPKSAAFAQVRALVRGGRVAGAPMSSYDAARTAGASPQASAIVEAQPDVGSLSDGQLYGRAFASASSPTKALRTLIGDRRTDDEIPTWEHAGSTLIDLVGFGAAGGAGAAVSEGAAEAFANRSVQTMLARQLSKYATDKAAKSLVSRVGSRVLGAVAENAGLQAVPIVGRASEMTDQNGKPFLANLADAGGEAAKGFVHTMTPGIFLDPNASPADKAVAAIMQGAMMLGAGFKGYDYVRSRGKALGIDPIVVESLVQAGRREVERGGAVVRPTDRIPMGGEPDAPSTSSAPPSPGLVDPSRRIVRGRPDAARTPLGETPRLIGDESAPPSALMANGEAIVRNDADRTRLQAMTEEFGSEEGLRRYVDDRVGSRKPATVELTTGTEMTRSEHDALTTRLARLERDRSALDELPQVPEDARNRFVRSFDADTLDPYHDDYSDDRATAAHLLLFGEHPPRDPVGEIEPAALERVRDEVETDREADYNRYLEDQETAHPEDAGDWEHLGHATGVLRKSKPRNEIPAGPDEVRGRKGSSPDDVITARRNPETGNWRYSPGRVPMVSMDLTTPDIAREIVGYVLDHQESDHSFLHRGEVTTYRKQGIKPNFLKLSEWMTKDVGDAWKEADFDRWDRIQIPERIVKDYVQAKIGAMRYAKEELAARLPDLSPQEIENLHEAISRGRYDARPGGERDAGADGGEAPDGGASSVPAEDRGDPARRPASPRRAARERLDAEIATTRARLGSARMVPDASPSLLHLGEPEPDEAKPLVGPRGEEVAPKSRRGKTGPNAPKPKVETPKVKAAPASAPRNRARTSVPEPPIAGTEPTRADTSETTPRTKDDDTSAASKGEVAARNADRDRARDARGDAPVSMHETDAPAELRSRAETILAGDPQAAARVASEVNARPRVLSGSEQALMDAAYDRDAAREKALLARINDPNTKAADVPALQGEYDQVRRDLDANDEATRKSGREWAVAGRARQAQRLTLSDPTDAVQILTATKGGKRASPETEARVRASSEALGKAEEALRASQAADARAAARKAVRSLSLETRKAARRGDQAALRDEFADLKRRFEAAADARAERNRGDLPEGVELHNSGFNPFTAFSVEEARLVAQMARNLVQRGALSLEDVVDGVRTSLSLGADVSDREIHDAISGYGHPAPVQGPPTAETARLAELRRVARLTSQIDDATNGTLSEARKAAPVSEQVADLRRTLAEVKAAKGIGKATQAELVASIRARIAEVEANGAPTPEARPDEPAPVREARAGLRDAIRQDRLKKDIAVLEAKIAAGDTTAPPKRTSPVESPETARLRGERDRLNARLRMMIELERPASFGSWVSRLQRAAIFSSPSIVGKMIGATATHVPVEMANDLFGMGFGRLPAGGGKSLGEVAASQGMTMPKAYIRGVVEMLSKATKTDSLAKLRTGHMSLDDAAIQRGQIGPEKHHPLLDLFGSIHGALHTPIQKAAYRIGLEKRTLAAARRGLDIHDPGVQTDLVSGAYGDSLEAIFRSPNALSTFLNKAMKGAGGGEGFLRVAVPVTSVASNIAGRTVQYTGAGLFEGMVRHALPVKAGDVTPEAADAILKAYKRGATGAALGILVLSTDVVQGPGMYAPGARKNDDERWGDVSILGHEVPHALTHGPVGDAIQVHLTLKRAIRDAREERDKEGRVKRDAVGAAGSAIARVGYGLGEQTPGVGTLIRVGKAAQSEAGLGGAAGEYVRSVVDPQLVQSAARGTLPGQSHLPEWARGDVDEDGRTTARKVTGFLDTIKEGIPGLRATLPPRKEEGGDYARVVALWKEAGGEGRGPLASESAEYRAAKKEGDARAMTEALSALKDAARAIRREAEAALAKGTKGRAAALADYFGVDPG